MTTDSLDVCHYDRQRHPFHRVFFEGRSQSTVSRLGL